MRKMGMMRNRMAVLLASGTMTMTSAAGLAGCTSAPASVTVQSAENTGITVTSQEKIKAEPDIAEITYSVYSQAADASTCQSENQTDLDAVLALLKEKGIADTSVQTSGLGLNPIYDSSIRRISGSTASARAMQRRCCCPPESPSAERFRRSLTSSHRAAPRRLFSTIASSSAFPLMP